MSRHGHRNRQDRHEAVSCVGSVVAPDFAERFVGTAVSTCKGLDIVVNIAGHTWDNVFQKMTDEQWNVMMDVHLTAPFRILRAMQLFRGEGRIHGDDDDPD
jgi:3-oxoacyl-[acyl-carrier protein] reductase